MPGTVIVRNAFLIDGNGGTPSPDATVVVSDGMISAVMTTPMEAIVSATRTNAELIGMADRIGTVEPGKLADPIAVDGNPLEDLRVFEKGLERVVLVMREGKIVKDITNSVYSMTGRRRTGQLIHLLGEEKLTNLNAGLPERTLSTSSLRDLTTRS